MLRLVMFLGTADSTAECTYALSGSRTTTRPTRLPWQVWLEAEADAIKDQSLEIVVVGTSTTKKHWLGNLRQDMRRSGMAAELRTRLLFLEYDEHELASSGDKRHFWQFFEALGDAMSGEPLVDGVRAVEESWPDPDGGSPRAYDRIIVDITHGYRSVPFVGAAALSHVRSTQRASGTHVSHRLFYTALEAAQGDVVPVWDLTPSVHATDLSAALDAFKRHGRADDLATFFERHGVRQWPALGDALRNFSDDLLFMRLPNLLGDTAPKLLAVLDHDLDGVCREYPPVSDELREFRGQLAELCPNATPTPSISPAGLRAALVLGRRLRSTGRNVELACLMGEAFLTAFELAALDPGPNYTLKQPVEKGFRDERESFKNVMTGNSGSNGMVLSPLPALAKDFTRVSSRAAESRNDLAHCSMRDKPKNKAELGEALDGLLVELDELVQRLPAQ